MNDLLLCILLFSEPAGQAIVAVPPAEEVRFTDLCAEHGLSCQKPAFRNMKSRSESRPIVGSGGGSVSWVAIMSSGRMRSGSLRKRAEAAGLSWSAVLVLSTMIITSWTVSS